jgi:hypothetical protein
MPEPRASKLAPADASGEPSTLIKVPASSRPPIGRTGNLTLEAALKRAEASVAEIVETHRAGLVEIISDLGKITMGASDPIEPVTAAKLLAVANDLRGVAVPLGLPLVGEIANVICDVVQRFRVGSTGAGPLVQMLYHALRQAYEAVGRGDRLQHEAEIRQLLKELRAKIAAGA